jgi:exodeoxyribonuclease VII large subunit
VQVEVRGRVALYEPRGELQLVVESMRALGAGSLYEQFLRSKAKLEAEGLFDAAGKRALPTHPRAVGVVTSTAGAALHDILTTLARRAPQVAVVVYPSLVQGAEAPAALVAALGQVALRREVDLVIVARGGGSMEDLWAFNDERVVRAIAALPMPSVAGVGHETDVTLADFVADLRAPTPTAAAELAAPARDDLLAELAALAERARRAVARRLDTHAQRLDRLALQIARPAQRLARAGERLQALDHRRQRALARALEAPRAALPRLDERLRAAMRAAAHAQQLRLAALGARLGSLDPTRVLARGYVVAIDAATRRPLPSARGAVAGQALELQWHDGRVPVRVTPPAEGA